jgi:flavodoxin
MNSTVVYESRYGNTARIARAIATRLEMAGPARFVEAADATAFAVAGVDLLVVGGPTEGHGVTPTLRGRLEQLPDDALKGVAAAAFDTRLNWPAFLTGSAAKGIARMLEEKGARLIAPPEGFVVKGMKEAHLLGGEVERAEAWAGTLRTEAAVGS